MTGGGRGIGRSVALALAQRGADVAVMARSAAELSEVAEAIQGMGRRALALSVDVADPAAVSAAVARVKAELGPVLVLVNNAGVAPSVKFQETTDDLWHRTMNINVTGAFYLCRAVLPDMLAAKWGRVINVASTAAKIGFMYSAAYVASKHALLGLTRALSLEVARRGVTVNAVCPGYVDTDIARAAVDNIVAKTGRDTAGAREALTGTSPQGRLMSTQEIAECVIYLSSEAAGGINGQGIVIDGGGVQS